MQATKIFFKATKVGESYNTMVEFIQINFTVGLPDSYLSLGIYTLSDKETKKDFIDNIKIYEFNIDKIKKECYNGKKRYDFVAALDYSRQELEKFCKGDKYMEAFKEGMDMDTIMEITGLTKKEIKNLK